MPWPMETSNFKQVTLFNWFVTAAAADFTLFGIFFITIDKQVCYFFIVFIAFTLNINTFSII
jgi:hypothetical protein